LKAGMPSQVQKEVANGRMNQGWLIKSSTRLVVEYPGCKSSATTKPPAASTSSRPAMKWDQSAPFTRTSGNRAAIRSRGVSSSNRPRRRPLPTRRPFGALLLAQNGTRRPLHAPHAGIRIEPQNQHVTQGPGLFQQADVSGMEQIEATVGEDHRLALGLPASPQFEEFVASVQRSPRSSV
jgi:hypothetical protein